MEYNKVAVGGTFDRLHAGHEKLLAKAFESGQRVVVGLTSDSFAQQKEGGEKMLPYGERLEELRRCLKGNGWFNRAEIVQILNLYGTTLSDQDLEVVVVSEETVKGAEAINKERKKLGLGPLKVEVVEVMEDEAEEKLSSQRIRQGLVDRKGRVFAKLFERDITLGEEQKSKLKVPMGELIGEADLMSVANRIEGRVVVVGDRVLAMIEDKKMRMDIGVYDNMEEREAVENKNRKADVSVNNPAGVISKEAVEGLLQVIKEGKGLVEIKGEEDLMVLPAVLLLPLRSMVVYGQPGQGMVAVQVNEASKATWYEFLSG